MSERAITGPKTPNGSVLKVMAEFTGPLARLGTSSAIKIGNDNWPEAANPLRVLAAIRVLTLLAVAPTIAPMRPRVLKTIKNHLRPNISERRPIRV